MSWISNVLRRLSSQRKRRHYTLESVFGIETSPIDRPSFVDRDVDKRLLNAVKDNAHIVLYGPSKQGKSWLVEKYISKKVRVGCSVNDTVDDVLYSILAKLTGDFARADTIRSTVGANLSLGGPHLGAGAQAQQEVSSTVSRHAGHTIQQLLDAGAAEQHVVLDNFHYLPEKTKRELPTVFRELIENGIRVVILGIAKEQDQLVQIAGDLSGRIRQIPLDDWEEKDLFRIASKGSEALNIQIPGEIILGLVKLSGRNVGLFQDLLKYYCREFNVTETLDTLTLLDDTTKMRDAVKTCFEETIRQGLQRIDELAKGKKSTYDTHYWVMKAICMIIAETPIDVLANGISKDTLKTRALGLSRLSESNLGQQITFNLNDRSRRLMDTPTFYVNDNVAKVYVLDYTILAAKEIYAFLGMDFAQYLGSKDAYEEAE